MIAQVLRDWWPILLGNLLEWYEFAVFAYLSKAMATNFFHGSELAAWAAFSVTFVARPLGGSVLAFLADRFGRRVIMLVSVAGMLAATVGQGLLPVGGLGLPLLLCLRLLQGVCAGGEVCSIATYCSEAAPRHLLCLYSSLAPATTIVAFSLASGVVALCELAVGDEAMLRWGWRLPFLLALPVGLVSLWGRRWLRETEDFERSTQERSGSIEAGLTSTASSSTTASNAAAGGDPKRQACCEQAPVILLGILSMAGLASAHYGGIIWSVSRAKDNGIAPATADLVGTLSHLAELVLMPLAAYLADKVGPATIMAAGAFLATVSSIPINAALEANPGNGTVAVLCISLGYGIVSSVANAVCYPFFAGFFPTDSRAFGFSLTFNVGMSYFGGFAAMILQALAGVSPHGPGIYLAATGLVSLAAQLTLVCLHLRGTIQISHLRGEPFFLLPRRWRSSPREPRQACAA